MQMVNCPPLLCQESLSSLATSTQPEGLRAPANIHPQAHPTHVPSKPPTRPLSDSTVLLSSWELHSLTRRLRFKQLISKVLIFCSNFFLAQSWKNLNSNKQIRMLRRRYRNQKPWSGCWIFSIRGKKLAT